MDPVSIAATVISLAETGFKIKNSVDKVSKNQARARELAEDILNDLTRIATFYEINKGYLANEALGQLRDSLDRLTGELHRLYKRCQRYERRPEHSLPKRVQVAMMLWMNSDDIEGDLIRLKERIQASLNSIILLSCARVEVRVLRLHEAALLGPYRHRYQLRQLDSTFAQSVYNGDPEMVSFTKLSTQIDDIDIQYIRMKSTRVVEALSNLRFALPVIEEGLFSAGPQPYLTCTNIEEDSLDSGFHLGILTSLTQLWAGVSISSQSANPFLLALETAWELSSLGCADVALNMYDALESLIHRSQLISSSAQKGRLLWALERILFRKAHLIGFLLSDEDTCDVGEEEAIKYALKGVQVCRTRLEHSNYHSSPFDTIQHHLELAHSLQPLIYTYYNVGRLEDCTNSCFEALELLSIADLSLQDLDDTQAYVLQLHSYTLYHLALTQRLAAQYTLAYHTGLQCVAGIKALSRVNIALPPNFDTLCYERTLLEQDFHSLTSIVREPSHISSRIEECLEDEDGSQLVKWGIAM